MLANSGTSSASIEENVSAGVQVGDRNPEEYVSHISEKESKVSVIPPQNILTAYEDAVASSVAVDPLSAKYAFTPTAMVISTPKPTTININGHDYTGIHIYYNYGYVNIDGMWSFKEGNNQTGVAHTFMNQYGGRQGIFSGVHTVMHRKRSHY
jgi:hypothetical protein